MNKNILLTISIILLLSLPVVFADAQLYLTTGVVDDVSYNQDGTGVWSDLESTTTQRGGSYNAYNSPLVADLNNDLKSEIVIMGLNNELQIINYTTENLIIIDSFLLGSNVIGSNTYEQTVGLIDYDSDDNIELIAFNSTHVITLEFNGTNLNIEQSVAHGVTNGDFSNMNNPIIRCGTPSEFSSGNYVCIIPMIDKPASTNLMGVVAYDLTLNTVTKSFSVSISASTQPQNTPLVDVNNDGNIDTVMVWNSEGNYDKTIYLLEYNATNHATFTQLYQHLESAPAGYTDIIVNDLDGTLGNGREITWGFTEDGINWDARTIKSDGSIYQSSYCGGILHPIRTCQNAEIRVLNMFVADSTTYSENTNDVCMYLKQYTTDTDSIVCVGQYGGDDYKETEIINPTNFTYLYPFVHFAKMTGGEGLVTSDWLIEGSTKLTVPDISDNGRVIPIDFQRKGNLDMLGITSTQIKYYDDAYTNRQVSIDDRVTDTGNPVCLNEIVGNVLTLSDEENDVGYCHISEAYGNGTIIGLSSNNSFSTPGTLTLNYNADDLGTKVLTFKCQDQFNPDTYDTIEYVITVSNDTSTCNYKGENPTQESFVAEDVQSEILSEVVDEVLDDYNLNSPGVKLFIGLLFALACGLYVFKETKGDKFMSSMGLLGGIILAIAFSFIEIWVLVTFVILAVTFSIYKLFGGGRQ